MQNETHSDVLSMQRATSVAFVRNNGCLVVKVAPGEKKPAGSWDPRANTLAISNAILDSIEFTKDNIGLHLHGRLVDVDVDNENPHTFAALDAFLPPTGHIWGRKSKPRSHRIYSLTTDDFDPGVYAILRTIKRIPEAEMEVRGGALSRAEFSVMPGSIHPSGEMYEWDSIASARQSPARVDVDTLLRGIRKAAAAAVMGSIWLEGTRQELSMALAGFLYRVHAMSEALGDDMFSMGFDESIEFFKTFLSIVGDDPSDRKDRIAAFKMTWRKAEEDIKVTGATRIAEIAGDRAIVNKLYRLLSDHPDMQKIEEYLQRFAIWVGPGNVIDLESEDSSGMRTIMSRTGFTNSYGFDFIAMGGKQRLLADAIFSMPATMRVNGMTFAPGKGALVDEGRNRYVNQWSGFKVEPAPTATAEEIKPVLSLIWNILARRRKEVYEFIMAWVADIFQEPDNKPGTALVFVGIPGSGKSFLGENVIRPIIGPVHSTQTNDIERVTAKHNTQIANKLFIQCDEATNSRQKATTARLKSLITDRTNTIEPKGVDSFDIPNHARYFMTSNDVRDAVHLPDGLADRRFVVAHVDEVQAGMESEYWDPLGKWCADEANLAKVLRFFLDYKYDKSKIRRAIRTPEKVRMIQSSWTDFEAWVVRAIIDSHPIADIHHKHPGQSTDSLGHPPKIVTRDRWPVYASLSQLTLSIRHVMNMVNSRNHAPSELEVYNMLIEEGLAEGVLHDVPVREIDERSGVARNTRYKMVQLRPLEVWAKWATERVGMEQPKVVRNDVKEGNVNNEF